MRRIFLGNVDKLVCGLVILPFLFSPEVFGATQSGKTTVVAKWDRFEKAFRSSVGYSNALQEATLRVVFTSPRGETNLVYGFWDGGRTWRARFSPNMLGRWQFRTTCSDTANRGLHNQAGEFVCTAATGLTLFNQHGPVRVARDHRHFEHSDGTPFFWLADMVWDGARVADPADWEFYASTRSSQKFTVAEWSVAPGPDAKHRTAFSGHDHITVNPAFFQSLDAKVETLSRAGILNVIAPLHESASPGHTLAQLPADQAALLVRYVAARWGADPVALLLCPDAGHSATTSGDWKKIGRNVFGEGKQAPVVLYSGHTHRLLDEFRDQNWVDAFGYASFADPTDPADKGIVNSPFAEEWTKEPIRPLIAFAPPENGISAQNQKRYSSDDTRHALYLGLLMSPRAGISYGGAGVANWELGDRSEDLPLWHKALFMPEARQIKYLAKLMASPDFWLLHPEPSFVPAGPTGLRANIAAGGTEAKDFSLIYAPGDRTVELSLTALPASATITWLNPRNTESKPAVAVVGEHTCQFPTPEPGDWLLMMKKGK